MAIPSIEFVPGQNHVTSGNPEQDPSGFERAGLTGELRRKFLGLFEQEWMHIARTVPEDIFANSTLPSPYEVYVPYNLPALAGAVNYGPQDLVNVERNAAGEVSITTPLRESEGIGLRVPVELRNGEKIQHETRRRIGHELLHTVVNPGMSAWMRSRMEAMMYPIEAAAYGPRTDPTMLDSEVRGWSRKKTQATDGFAEDDFSSHTMSIDAANAMYAACSMAFEGIDHAAVWKIWSALIELGSNKKAYPTNAEIEAAVLNVLQETGQSVLESPAFRIMQKEGLQTLVLENASMANAVVFSTFRKKNPTFGLRADGTWEGSRFSVQAHAMTPYKQTLYNKRGTPAFGIAPEKITASFGEEWSVPHYKELIRNMGPAQRSILGDLGSRITNVIEGLEIELCDPVEEAQNAAAQKRVQEQKKMEKKKKKEKKAQQKRNR